MPYSETASEIGAALLEQPIPPPTVRRSSCLVCVGYRISAPVSLAMGWTKLPPISPRVLDCAATWTPYLTTVASAYRSLHLVVNRQSLLLLETWHVHTSLNLSLSGWLSRTQLVPCSVWYGISHSAESSINQGLLAISCHSSTIHPAPKRRCGSAGPYLASLIL